MVLCVLHVSVRAHERLPVLGQEEGREKYFHWGKLQLCYAPVTTPKITTTALKKNVVDY